MKKTFAAALSAVMVGSLALTGCQSNTRPTPMEAPKEAAVKTEENKTEDTTAAADQQVTIAISNQLEAGDATSAISRELLDDFMAANPGTKVESQIIPFSQYRSQVSIVSASGNVTDVIMDNSQMMNAFNGAGILAELGALASKKVLDDIYPGCLSGTTYDDKVKALPWAPRPIAIYYNKEPFTKAGLDPEEAPTTWDEVAEAAKVIAALGKDDAGNTLYGLGIPAGKVARTGTVFNGIFYTYGGHFVDDAGTVDLSSAGNMETLTWAKQLVDEKMIPDGLEIKDLRGLFASGQIDTIFDGDMGHGAFRSSGGLDKESDKKMDVAIIPAGETGRSETVYTEHQLGVFVKSKNREAAVRLVEYLIDKDAMAEYHKSNAILSARKSIATLPEIDKDEFMEVFNKQSETASPLPATNAIFDNVMSEVIKGVERVVVNSEDTAVVLEETNKTIREMCGQ